MNNPVPRRVSFLGHPVRRLEYTSGLRLHHLEDLRRALCLPRKTVEAELARVEIRHRGTLTAGYVDDSALVRLTAHSQLPLAKAFIRRLCDVADTHL